MIPKILISQNASEIENYIQSVISKYTIPKTNIFSLGDEKNSIKIDEIRELKQRLIFKTHSGNMQMLIFQHAENLTEESQNACLKILEEPPPNTIIFLNTGNENLLLPTIVSRCEIVRLKPKTSNPTFFSNLEFKIPNLMKMDIGEKFKTVEDLVAKKDKEEKLEETRRKVLVWLDNVLKQTPKEKNNIAFLKSASIARSQIQKNLNLKLVLENFLLNC